MNTTITHPDTRPMQPTEQFDSLGCVSSSARHESVLTVGLPPRHYLQVEGHGEVGKIPLDRGVVHLGRGVTAGLHLDDASISRRHAVIVQLDDGHKILDDRSLNGTYVNDRRIVGHELHDGDVIRLGRLELVYRGPGG